MGHWEPPRRAVGVGVAPRGRAAGQGRAGRAAYRGGASPHGAFKAGGGAGGAASRVSRLVPSRRVASRSRSHAALGIRRAQRYGRRGRGRRLLSELSGAARGRGGPARRGAANPALPLSPRRDPGASLCGVPCVASRCGRCRRCLWLRPCPVLLRDAGIGVCRFTPTGRCFGVWVVSCFPSSQRSWNRRGAPSGKLNAAALL